MSLWVVVLLLGMIASITMVWMEWRKNSHSATLTALDTSHYPIWNIDFPAVTVCSINRIRKSKAFQLSREWVLPGGVTRNQVLQDISQLTQLTDLSNPNITQLDRLQAVLDLNNISAEAALRKVMLPCEDMFIRCKFKGSVKDCSNFFEVTKTPYGFCCSFNYHGRRLEHTVFTLSPSGLQDPYRTERTSACGFGMGLSVLIKNSMEEYHDTTLASHGVKVLLHSPRDFPNDNTDMKLLSTGTMMMLSVYPQKFETAESVKELGLYKRGCILRSERELLNLKVYTYNNCIVECRHNYTIQLCGCSPFYFPSRGGYRTCNLTDVPCLNNNKIELMEMGQTFDKDEEFVHIPRTISTNQAPCNCLPECSNLWYSIENSQADLDREDSMKLNYIEFFDRMKVTPDHSLLHVYFIDLVGTRYMKNVYYTWHQQLASIGGVLSLFLGFTLISILEFVYFFTIRLFFSALRSTEDNGKTRTMESSTSTTPVSTGSYIVSTRTPAVHGSFFD